MCIFHGGKNFRLATSKRVRGEEKAIEAGREEMKNICRRLAVNNFGAYLSD